MKTYVIDNKASSATPVVFIHGFPFSHAMWTPQLEALGNSYRTVAYDIRGHGQSEVGDGQYTIDLFVEDLVNVLHEHTIGKAVFVALSMGGYIALRLYERHPELFKGLVLCDTRSEPDTNEGKIKRFALMEAVKRDGVAAFARDFVKSVLARETFEKNPEAIRFVQDMIERNSPIGIAGTLLALASRTDTTPSLASISVPTLIMVGEHDPLTPVSSAEAMKQRIRGSVLQIISHAAHMSNLENSGMFNSTLHGFLQGIS